MSKRLHSNTYLDLVARPLVHQQSGCLSRCARIPHKLFGTLSSSAGFASGRETIAPFRWETNSDKPEFGIEQNGTNSGLKDGCKIEKMVARDGIEPPTPAFSGLLTDSAKSVHMNFDVAAVVPYSVGTLGYRLHLGKSDDGWFLVHRR